MCLTYSATYWLMKGKTRRLHRTASKPENSEERGLTRGRKEKMPKLSAKLQTQLMKTATLIIFVFVLSLLPFWSFTVIGRYCKTCTKERWYIACYRFSIPILYSNSAFNPLLYAWRMRTYRRSFQALFTGLKRDYLRESSSADKTRRDEICLRDINFHQDESNL